MAKKKHKSSNQHNASKDIGRQMKPKKIEDFANAVFQERSNQFQRSGTSISDVFEGLDFDHVHAKRRISASLSMIEEVKNRFGPICSDVPDRFSIAEDWITVNAYPISAYDYVEKHVYSVLGAAIWILDYLRDHGKLSQLTELLTSASYHNDAPMPPVWDACHSEQLLTAMVAVISNRNSDCIPSAKRSKKEKRTISRCYMDKCTAEGKIDHSVPSRVLFDKVIGLIDPETLEGLKDYYTEKYWDWVRRYYLCRNLFLQEELAIRADIEDFHDSTQQVLIQNEVVKAISSNKMKQQSVMMPGALKLPNMDSAARSQEQQNYFFQVKALEYRNGVLYRRQEEFNSRFESFTREIGEFSLMPHENLSAKYGTQIADVWSGFQVKDPYSMCTAFLLLLDGGSDLPWCYFAGVNLQSFYVSMLPWTRRKFIGSCDDIWEHYDAEIGEIIPGPGSEPLPKKIKVPEMDDWYQMKYFDATNKESDNVEQYNLSHILYEVTGCIMPRNLERHQAALRTLNRYGINNKKANHYLTYCMALLGEAKHQSVIYGLQNDDLSKQECDYHQPSEESIGEESVESLKDTISSLRSEINRYKQAVQDANQIIKINKDRITEMETQVSVSKQELSDLSSLIFGVQDTDRSLGINFPYRTASRIICFGGDPDWLKEMKAKLPDVLFSARISRGTADIYKKTDVVWIQTAGISYSDYQNIVHEMRRFHIPVRYFSSTNVSNCAAQLVKADIASC